MTPLLFAILCCAQADAVELQGTMKSEPFDIEIGLPKGWTVTRPGGASFFRAEAPKTGSLDEGAAWLEYHENSQPVTLAYLSEIFGKRASADYPGFKSLGERDVQVAGYPGKQIIFTVTGKGKEVVIVHTIIQRQLQEYLLLNVVAAVKDREGAVSLSDKMLSSIRTGFPVSREREARVRATMERLKAAAPKPGLAGTFWHELFVSDRKFGRQKLVLREATVDGAPGWEFEIESVQEDTDGGMRSDISKGAFTADGSVQRVELQRLVKTPKDPEVNVKETASIVKGTFRAVRHLLGQKFEKEFKAPEGTYLADVAETIRRWGGFLPAGTNAIRILDPFRDVPVIEEWEHAAPSKIKIDGVDREVIQLIASADRRDPVEYLFDTDGSLRQRRGAAGFLVLKRCTEEQALKR